VEIDVNWSAADLERQPVIRVCIRDNGHGLSPE
jgi:hypothetical protein